MSTFYFSNVGEAIGEPAEEECVPSVAERLGLESPEEQKVVEEDPKESLKSECMENFRRRLNKIGKNIIFGTKETKFETEADCKVSFLCCNVPSKWILWTLGISAIVIIWSTACNYANEYFRLYETFPWIVPFALAGSLTTGMWRKSAKWLIPFRIACALARCMAIVVIFARAFCSSVMIINNAFAYAEACTNTGELKNTFGIMIACGIAYLVLGRITTAATICYHFFKTVKSADDLPH